MAGVLAALDRMRRPGETGASAQTGAAGQAAPANQRPATAASTLSSVNKRFGSYDKLRKAGNATGVARPKNAAGLLSGGSTGYSGAHPYGTAVAGGQSTQLSLTDADINKYRQGLRFNPVWSSS